MKTTSSTLANYRIYDRTGGGVTEDIIAENLEDAIQKGRDWIEAGDWEQTDDEQTLDCCVREIVRYPEPDEDDKATGRDGEALHLDEDGDLVDADGYLYCTPADFGEIDEDATSAADSHDCSGTLPAKDAPECVDGDCDGHDWQSPYSVLGGCKENPGVWGSGHGQVMSKSVCACCGLYRTVDYGATNSSNGTKTTRTTYEQADDDSIAWIMRRLHLPESIEIKAVEVTLEWDKAADIRQDDDAIGTAIHTVNEVDLDAGIADGPNDGETFEVKGVTFKIGSHDYETDDGKVTCSASIYRVL
jgi:hypothetical protein